MQHTRALSPLLWPIHIHDAEATELNNWVELLRRRRCEMAITRHLGHFIHRARLNSLQLKLTQLTRYKNYLLTYFIITSPLKLFKSQLVRCKRFLNIKYVTQIKNWLTELD